MRMPAGLKEGDEVRIRFLDHVEDGQEAIDFTVWGRISLLTKRTIAVECWAYTDLEEQDKHNVKMFTIVKKAILALHVMVPSRRKRVP